MALVGAFARVEPGTTRRVRTTLDAIDGVHPFELKVPDRVGVLIEACDLDHADSLLTSAIRTTPGVLGVRAVYAHPAPGRPARA